VIGSGGLGTFFSCTSTDTTTQQAGVELFPSGGGAPANDAAATALTIGPGATVMFGTSVAAGLSVNSSLGGGFSKGSARILSTSKKLVCTAFVADITNAPPTTSWALTIIAKLKQKAAN
jgi:hypothetical protein